MSFLAILLMGAAATTSPGGHSLMCQEVAQGDEVAKSFQLAFSLKGSKVNKITLNDPKDVLDPLGGMPVYSPASSTGPLVLNVTEAPPRKPINLKGRVVKESGFEFTAKDPALNLRLIAVPGKPGSFTYSFEGSRLLSGVMRMAYTGAGTCTAAEMPTVEQSK